VRDKKNLADDAIGNRSHDSSNVIAMCMQVTHVRILLTIVNEKNYAAAFIEYPQINL